jgi:hypothetical protein
MIEYLKRMSDDLQLAGYSPRTCESYLHGAKKFLEYFKKPAETIS